MSKQFAIKQTLFQINKIIISEVSLKNISKMLMNEHYENVHAVYVECKIEKCYNRLMFLDYLTGI